MSIANRMVNSTRAQNKVFIGKDADGVVTRWQKITSNGGFAMLIRMPRFPFHYCGYVHVSRETWKRLGTEELIQELRISYDGPGTKDIQWRAFNQNHKLVVPVKLAAEDSADHWLGFDLQSQPYLALEDCINILGRFYGDLARSGIVG